MLVRQTGADTVVIRWANMGVHCVVAGVVVPPMYVQLLFYQPAVEVCGGGLL